MTKASAIAPERGGEPPPQEEVVELLPVKPTRDECKAVVRKLGKKPYAPAEAYLQGVVIDAVWKAAQTREHLDRIVGKLLEDCDHWPDVTEIRDVGVQTRDMDMRPDPDCEHCGGCGFRPVRRKIDGVMYDYSGRCSCWRMVRLA